jgi:3-phenylpropionate/cinnamic acid dioxygenase small subunit
VCDELIRSVEQFLYREARLLDERRFHEWLDCFTEDTHYWMPTRINRIRERDDEDWAIQKEVADPDEMAWFDDTKKGLSQRVARLDTAMAWAEEPPSRTRHYVMNIEVEPGRTEGEVTVRSNFLVFRGRLEYDADTFHGGRVDVLRKEDGAWKIASRTIIYDATVSPAKNMSLLF